MIETAVRSRRRSLPHQSSAGVQRTLSIHTPCRLHFGLIDMNGEIGRAEGSLGVALEAPAVELHARRGHGVSIGGAASVCDSTRPKFESMCAQFRKEYGTDGIDIEVRQVIPDHSGLGSGTQLALAFGQAMNVLYDLRLSVPQVARIAHRGGTSGIGCAAFELGGFLVDGGHRFGVPGGKKVFAPSAASTDFAPPPILFHAMLPASWRILLALPVAGYRTHGKEERQLFLKHCPVPAAEAAQSARLALLKVMPAVLEQDLESFGEGIEAMQLLGFKRVQLARQNAVVHATLAEMRRLGLRGVGMSSWGPALFGFSDQGAQSTQALARALENFGTQHGGIGVFDTRAAEHGTTWEWE